MAGLGVSYGHRKREGRFSGDARRTACKKGPVILHNNTCQMYREKRYWYEHKQEEEYEQGCLG